MYDNSFQVSTKRKPALKIDFKCQNCQRNLRVASEHIGKKVKCPGCDTISLIEEPSAQELPVAQKLPKPPPQPASLFDSELDPLWSSNPQANTNPYHSLAATDQPVDHSFRAGQSDVLGILSAYPNTSRQSREMRRSKRLWDKLLALCLVA